LHKESAVKLALKIIAAIIALVLIAILALVLFFDLNSLKPRIEAAAREQGVDLQMRGDLSWTFWPSIGIAVEDIRVAAVAAPEQSLAQLQQASFLVAVSPLFRGAIQVDHIRVQGAAIELTVDAQGKGNWEALTVDTEATDTEAAREASEPASAADPQTTTAPAPSEESREFSLAVDRISVLDSSLNYRDAQNDQELAVILNELDIRQFNLQGEPFNMTLALTTTLSSTSAEAPLTAEVKLAQRVQLSAGFEHAEITNGRVDLTLNKDGKVAVNYDVKVDGLQDALRYSGNIDVPAFNARKLLAALGTDLETSANYALTKVGLEARMSGDSEQLTLDPLQVTLDKTTITGSVAVTDISTSAVRVVLQGDAINVDDYLAPAAETETATAAGTGDEELIPLDTLRDLTADIRTDFKQVTLMAIPLENIRFHLTANDGLLRLQQGDAQVYQGQITSTGSLDGRGTTAIIQLQSKVSEVQLEPALKDLELDENVQISGAINADTTASLRGVTMNQLMETLTAEANFSGNDVRFAPLNVEEKFCQLVNLVNQEAQPERNWEAFTRMHELTGRATIANQVLTVESFKAGVHQLLLGVQGQINLAANEYDFVLPLTLLNEESSAQGCRVSSNYWINRSLSLLRCRGSLESVNPASDCRPDSRGLTSLTKDFAEFTLREKYGDDIEEKKDELRQKVDEKLGVETEGQKPRDLLKGLLNRKLEERTRDDSTAAPTSEEPSTQEPSAEEQPAAAP
jgi:AsmA protein